MTEQAVESCEALVVGGGPAGLMAAEQLLAAGHRVLLVEAKPSLARKFLMAGKSGLNLTKDEPPEAFLRAYGDTAPQLRAALEGFGPAAVRDWAAGLGQTLFTGSTGRVFPVAMKASPLLRAWLGRLEGAGLERRTRWRWTGWEGEALCFETPEGARRIAPRAAVFALGGASWARLGSDGAWAPVFARDGHAVAPFQPSNAGLRVDWSERLARHFGQPLKNIALRLHGVEGAAPPPLRGEAMLSARGLEGGAVYTLTPYLRAGARLGVDLLPDLEAAEVARRIARPRGKTSLSNHLRKVLRLDPAKQALLMEMAAPLPHFPEVLAQIVKDLPIRHAGPRPMDEAISTAGGLRFDALDAGLMLRARPGTFCAGEMLDWEAPTGGYLLTACLATGRLAGRSAAAWLGRDAG